MILRFFVFLRNLRTDFKIWKMMLLNNLYESPSCNEVELIVEAHVLVASGNLGDMGNNKVYEEEF